MKKYLMAYGNAHTITIEKDEYLIIDELLSLGYLNRESFVKFEERKGKIVQMNYLGEYPLTLLGKGYYDMRWYQVFKESGKYQIIRDVAAFFGAIAGILIGVLSLL